MTTRMTVAFLAAAWAACPAFAGVPAAEEPGAPGAQSSLASGASDAWLGLFLEDEPDGGARIAGVIREGPAARAGLEDGDLLLSVNGMPVTGRLGVRRLVGPLKVGERLVVEVLRDGKVERREIVAAPPEIRVPARRIAGAPPGDAIAGRVGIEIVSIPAQLRRFYGAPDDSGLLVTAVVPGSAAAAAGLRVGDIAVRAGERGLGSGRDFDEALLGWPDAGSVKLRLVRTRSPVEIVLSPPEGEHGAVAREARVRALEEEVAAIEGRLEELRRELRILREAQ